MDRRILKTLCLGLTPCASLALASLLAAAEPFAWEQRGPAMPGGQPRAAQTAPAPAGRPRYDESYPMLRNEAASAAPRAPVAHAPGSPSAPPAPARAAMPVVNPTSLGLAAAARQTDLHVKRGTELGNRRAYYSARAEFIQALRVMSQALDVEHRTDGHSQALAAGLKALDESDDFVARGQTFESELNVARIAAVHRTPVVRSDAEGISPRVALERYYTFAQEQLASSMGSLPAGSAALSALGKLNTVLAEEQPEEVVSAQAKAMALHQAALVVDANNPIAANELGVLLARFGRHKDALAWLQHSASLSPQPATWHNLAVVHQQLGETNYAEQARQQEHALVQRTGRRATSVMPEIRWVSPRELDASPVDRPVPAAAPAPAPGNPRPPQGMRSAEVPTPTPSVARLPGIQSPAAATFE